MQRFFELFPPLRDQLKAGMAPQGTLHSALPECHWRKDHRTTRYRIKPYRCCQVEGSEPGATDRTAVAPVRGFNDAAFFGSCEREAGPVVRELQDHETYAAPRHRKGGQSFDGTAPSVTGTVRGSSRARSERIGSTPQSPSYWWRQGWYSLPGSQASGGSPRSPSLHPPMRVAVRHVVVGLHSSRVADPSTRISPRPPRAKKSKNDLTKLSIW
jgi:hypothetical protein